MTGIVLPKFNMNNPYKGNCRKICSIPFQKPNLLRRTDDDDQALLAADLHRPYRLEQWADGIPDGPLSHSNGAGLDFSPFHHFGPFATFSPSGP